MERLQGAADRGPEALKALRERFSLVLDSIEDDLDERRRLTSVGGTT